MPPGDNNRRHEPNRDETITRAVRDSDQRTQQLIEFRHDFCERQQTGGVSWRQSHRNKPVRGRAAVAVYLPWQWNGHFLEGDFN